MIELLIVVSISAILAALIFSGVASMSKRAQAAKCISNLRGLGTALGAYAADHRNMLLPRSLGLYRTTEAPEPIGLRAWPARLLNLGYIESEDIFYCPASFPRNAKEANHSLATDIGPFRTYGMRIWVTPSEIGRSFTSNPQREEHKPLHAIEKPSNFFILTDSHWAKLAPPSQGYGINPDIPKEQMIDLRHFERANSLFADGHVEAKDQEYYESLGESQKAYTGGKVYSFGVLTH